MLGVDVALILTIAFGTPLCAYALFKKHNDSKLSSTKETTITKEIEAKDGTTIKIKIEK